MSASRWILLLAENVAGAFTQLLGSRPGQRTVEFVGVCQKPDIFIGVFTRKSVSRALTTLEASSFAILFYQALNLDARITAELLQKTQYQPFVQPC